MGAVLTFARVFGDIDVFTEWLCIASSNLGRVVGRCSFACRVRASPALQVFVNAAHVVLECGIDIWPSLHDCTGLYCFK